MIGVLSTNILSPLGFTTGENYQAVRSGRSSLTRYESLWGIPEPLCMSLFTEEQRAQLAEDGLTRFESLAYHSIREALSRVDFDVSSSRVVFILATTKGNIERLEEEGNHDNLADAAYRIALRIGITTLPIVVCNACISGVSAQLLALRLLEANRYDYAVVCGADCQNRFTASGFYSLMALSSRPCRPFDMERCGLNLGEAAATIVFSRAAGNLWCLCKGAVRNDAFHISNPSKTAEGCFKAITAILREDDELSLISVHGTATLYNDQMESVALERAGLTDIPAMALKGYYGHTMGAAGVLETILSMCCVDAAEALASRGFEELGVSGRIDISGSPLPLRGHSFLKIISGFGGCNAALYYSKQEANQQSRYCHPVVVTQHCVKIMPHGVTLDGRSIAVESYGKALLTELYKRFVDDYPKFYKMDMLSRLAFVSSEFLLHAMSENNAETEDSAVVLFNRSSSVISDREFQKTISESGFFPSPSVFVYTLPNIAAGEIAIRNRCHGETSFYILQEKSERMMDEILCSTFMEEGIRSMICGWIDCEDEEHFEAELYFKVKHEPE